MLNKDKPKNSYDPLFICSPLNHEYNYTIQNIKTIKQSYYLVESILYHKHKFVSRYLVITNIKGNEIMKIAVK